MSVTRTIAIACTLAGLSTAVIAQEHGGPAKVRTALTQALPQLDGGHIKVSVVEVEYGPGGSSHAHSHPCPVAGYVIEGAVRMQVKGGAEKIYRAGESFYEAPNGVHLVSANASNKVRARFVAYFVCDRDTDLSVPVSESKQEKGGR